MILSRFYIKNFLFTNLSPRQTIFKNTFWLTVAEGLTRFLKLILVIYVARILGPSEYGKFTFALSFVSLFAIFSDLGISQIAIRELARDKAKEKEFSSILSLKIILALGTAILILIGSFFITSEFLIQKVIWILAVSGIFANFLGIIFVFFQARQRMEYEAWAKIIQAVIGTIFGFLVILNFPSVQNLSFSYLFANLIALIIILLFFHFKVYRLNFAIDKSIWKKFLAMSWPLALTGVFGAVYNQTDSVMMGYLGQIIQTGWYNAAYKIIGITLIPATLISTNFFPALSLSFKQGKEKLQKIWNYQMEIMILLAIPLVVGGITLSPRIIDFIYDPNYFPSIFAFQILIIMAGISFLCNPFTQVLVVSNHQKKLFWVSLSGAIINIILNLVLIPHYSLYGAAGATVATFVLILFLLFNFTIKFTSIKPLNLKFLFTFIGAALSSILMYFVISYPYIYSLNVFLSILIGAGVYFFCFLMYRKIIKNLV